MILATWGAKTTTPRCPSRMSSGVRSRQLKKQFCNGNVRVEPQTSIVDDPCINRGVDTKIGSFCPQIQHTLFDKFSNLPFLFKGHPHEGVFQRQISET